MRFLAAAMVVAVHAIYFVCQLPPGPDPSVPHLGLGAAGVDIFFVISGFVICRSALKRPAATTFFRKRFLRIAPIYYIATLTMFPVCALFGAPMPDGPSMAASFTFWPAWKYLAAPINPVGWSLCFEMLFYAAAGLTLLSRRALPILLLAYAAAWFARTHLGWPAFRFMGNPIILEFLFGVLLASRWKPESLRPMWQGVTVLLFGFAGLYIFCLPAGQENARFVIDGTNSFLRALSWGIPAALIVSGALALEPHLKGAWVRWLVYLGDASYSIYLVHWPLFALIGGLLRISSTPQWPCLEPILFVLGIAAGVAVYQFVETPLTAAINRASAYARVAS